MLMAAPPDSSTPFIAFRDIEKTYDGDRPRNIDVAEIVAYARCFALPLTWFLIPRQMSDPVKARALLEFVWWATHDGQKFTKELDYAPLPEELVKKIDAKLKEVE